MDELTYIRNEAAKDAQTDYRNWKNELSAEDREMLEDAEGTEDYEEVFDLLVQKTYNPF